MSFVQIPPKDFTITFKYSKVLMIQQLTMKILKSLNKSNPDIPLHKSILTLNLNQSDLKPELIKTPLHMRLLITDRAET